MLPDWESGVGFRRIAYNPEEKMTSCIELQHLSIILAN